MAIDARRIVCFDLGGVLVRICRSWGEACARASLPERDAAWLASDAWRDRRRAVGESYQRGEVSCSVYFSALVESLGGLYTREEVEQIHRVWTLEHYPGALELVRALNAQPHIVTACLSNTNHAHWVRLAGADGRGEYPAVVELRHQLASHLLGCGKPGPEIYARAQAVFTEDAPVDPANILFFDDLAENVLAARAAGWTAFQVDPTGDTVAEIRAHLAGAGVHV
jgi:HAD superfamily hydrolase (TIGR01509 family)